MRAAGTRLAASHRHPLTSRRLVAAFAVALACAGSAPVQAGDAEAAFDGAKAYVGAFAGFGRMANRFRDVAGFANWGNPGSRLGYDGNEPLGGLLVGRKFDLGATQGRIELDAALADISAGTSRLDPGCTDESAKSSLRWVVSLRAGVEKRLGGATVFASGGPALARIVNSVTDIDYSGSTCLERDLRLDADDSFRRRSTRLGLAVGVGVETPLTNDWTVRLEATWFAFGRTTHLVNRSGNNPCGPGGPRAPCPYEVENSLGLLRLAIVRRI